MNVNACVCTRPGTRAAIITAVHHAAPWLRTVSIHESRGQVTVHLGLPWWARLVGWALPRYRRTRVLHDVGTALLPVQAAGIRYSVTADTARASRSSR